jgi:hypothetical protein
MYYGHASWIALVIFGGMFAIRYLSSHRRKEDQPGNPTAKSSFTATDRGGPVGGRMPEPRSEAGTQSAGTQSAGTAPGWFADPYVRHERRYWSGTAWTEHVTDRGVPATDPPPVTPNRGDAD